jgi:hypothetical protein
MIIDYKKILNINNKKDLQNYKLDKPIFQANYLFHYLIMLGNIKGLKLAKFPVYIENADGLNGFHLAAKENNLEILCYLIDTYPEYIYNQDKNNNSFTYYLEFENFYILLKKYPKLDWNYLISDIIFNNIINNLNYSNLKKFLSVYKKTPEQHNQYLFNIIGNNYISTKLKIKILDTFSDDEINVKHIVGLIFIALETNNQTLFDYLLERNIDIDYFTSNNTNMLFNSIFVDIRNNKFYYSKQIINKLIKKNPNFMNENNYLHDNIAHNLLYTRINRNNENADYSIDLNILKYCNDDCWNQHNNEKITPLELLTKLDFNVYSTLITKISIDQHIIKKIKNMEIDKRWIKLYKSMPKYNNKDDNIKIKKYEYKQISTFAPSKINEWLFNLYIIENNDILFPIIDSQLLERASYNQYNETLNFDKIITSNPVFPNEILFYSKDNYYIHPYLNNFVNSYKKRFLFINLTLVVDDTNYHANIIIYDYKNTTIERFEPYGAYVTNKIPDLDDILEEELTWNTGFKYISPKDFMGHISFQLVSDETNDNNKKHGDPEGYCLAWCYWYLETKLSNPDVDSQILVHKLIKKLNNLDIKFSEYIRNYANKLDIEKNKFLKIIGIDPKNYYDKNIDHQKIYEYVVDRYTKYPQ